MKTIPRIINIIAISVVVLGLSGCKTYMHFKYGLTQPKEETPATLISFLEKNHFPTGNQYVFTDSGSYGQVVRNPEFRKYLLSHMIFDREGLLMQHDTNQCQWAGCDRIKALTPDSAYEKCNDLRLAQLLGYIQPFPGNSSVIESPENPDFTVIVTWAKFIGTYNYRLFALSDAVSQNKTAKIRLIWLNLDMQENWKLSKEQKVAIK
jgi:hypothetical protein